MHGGTSLTRRARVGGCDHPRFERSSCIIMPARLRAVLVQTHAQFSDQRKPCSSGSNLLPSRGLKNLNGYSSARILFNTRRNSYSIPRTPSVIVTKKPSTPKHATNNRMASQIGVVRSTDLRLITAMLRSPEDIRTLFRFTAKVMPRDAALLLRFIGVEKIMIVCPCCTDWHEENDRCGGSHHQSYKG